MKKVTLLATVLFATIAASAQLSLGVKAGANLSNFRGKDAEGSKSKIGFHVGINSEYSLGNGLSIAPELVYSLQGVKSEAFEDEEVPGSEDVKLNMSYLQIPILVKYTLQSGFFVTAGVQPGFLLQSKLKYDGESIDAKEGVNKFDFSVPVGIGFESSKNFGVSLRYNLGLSKIPEDGDAKIHHGVAQLSLTYRLFNKF